MWLQGGESVNERIRALRKKLGLTLDSFGQKIGITMAAVSNIENGRSNPSNQVLLAICREFHVSETWIRTGEGEMMDQLDEDQELVEFMTGLLGNSSDSFKKRFVSVLANLDPGDWAALERIADEIANRKTDP